MAVMAITGGTAGVGKATALRFARAGYDVGIIARDGRSLEATKQELLRCGVRVHTVQADVANADALLTAAGEIENRLGAIEVWVNNAMCAVLAPFRAMTHDEFRRVTEVTYLGYVNGTRAALALMTPGIAGDYRGWLRARLSLHSATVRLLRGKGRDSGFYRCGAYGADA